MNNEGNSYLVNDSKGILESVDSFCQYYKTIGEYISKSKIIASVDRGAFSRPHQILDLSLREFIGKKKKSKSFAYGPESGDYEVRERIAKIENLKHNTNYKKENIVMVPGAWSGVELVLEELSNLKKGNSKKTKVLVFGPTHYQLFHRAINVLGIDFVSFNFVKKDCKSVPTKWEEIETAINLKPNAIFITNPNNPNGDYFDSHFLKKLIKKCKERGIFVIIDEIQDFFQSKKSNGLNYNSWIKNNNVIRIDSYSKKKGLAEYRVGWVIANEKFLGDRLTGVIGRMSGFMGNAPRAANNLILKILELEEIKIKTGKDYFKPKLDSLQRKEKYIINALKDIPEIEFFNRESCINLTMKVNCSLTDKEFSKKLMDKGVLLMPCSGYGYLSEDTVMRFTFAERWGKIEYAIKKIKEVLHEIRE